MNKALLIICIIFAAALSFVSFPDGATAVVLLLVLTIPTIYLIRRYSDGNEFLVNVFLLGLLVRIFFGLVIYLFDLQRVFGPDAIHYDLAGQRLMEIWAGLPVPDDSLTYTVKHPSDAGMGMYYLVASIYYIFGANNFIAQTFCGFIGALTIPMTFFCADKIFKNSRVSKLSAVFIAVFPSFVIWSSQLLKDGLLIFLIVSVMVLILQLRKKINYLQIVLLVAALSGILTLRFYIFYMVVVSVVGSFVIGLSSNIKYIIRNVTAIIFIGLILTYVGVIRNAESILTRYGNLERVQNSRLDLSQSADSGFGEDLDVSTPAGALAAIPIGFVYLYFAPFPWQVTKLNQVLILPETFLWWSLIPLLIGGFYYTIKNKLLDAIPILTFTLMLTIAYSIFQGNVGMLYRQRTQIQVFLFIFIAVGVALISERRENKKIALKLKDQKLSQHLRTLANSNSN